MFSINCLEITATKEQWEKNKSIYKNLLSDDDFASLTTDDTPVNKRFLFNDLYKEENGCLVPNTHRFLPDNFFGENINIQAIVGKNGSGKSTLMDLMYMAINNFCYMFERGHKRERPGAEQLYYVPGLFLNLYFQLNKNSYNLKSYDNLVELQNKAKDTTIFEAALDEPGNEKPLAKQRFNNSKIASIVDDFFYTIVSNYSMQSFVDENYKQNIYFFADELDFNRIKQKKEFIDHDCPSSNKLSWISPIFHKNDGYIRSIVLNPYRDHGVIDLANEYELSKDRVASLFISTDISDNPKKTFFHPYKFSHLKISENRKKVENYLCNFLREVETIDNPRPHPNDTLINNFFKSIDDDFAIAIREHFKLPKITAESEAFENFCYSIGYIKIKLYKITRKYASYKPFEKCFQVKYIDNSVAIHGDSQGISKLLDFITNKPSHITKKIRRVVNFLSMDKGIFNPYVDLTYLKKKLENRSVFFNPNGDSNKELVELQPYKNGNFLAPQLFDDILPPPIFDWDLVLNKVDDNGNITSSIEYNQLSSGEVQLLQTISIHVYHLMNLVSVPNNSEFPKYRHFNLVFDEVEICFHPEMQREFVNRLIKVIADLDFPKDHFINIFFITHSPFILSDIPACNVLFLKDGQTVKNNRYKTFGANISDLCKDSFFLENGFVGELAKEKTNSLAKFLATKRKNNKIWSKESARNFIKNIIGETIVQNCLATLFSVKYGEEV